MAVYANRVKDIGLFLWEKACFLRAEKWTLQRRWENRLCSERIFSFDLYNTDKNGKISNRLARELPLKIRKKYISGGR